MGRSQFVCKWTYGFLTFDHIRTPTTGARDKGKLFWEEEKGNDYEWSFIDGWIITVKNTFKYQQIQSIETSVSRWLKYVKDIVIFVTHFGHKRITKYSHLQLRIIYMNHSLSLYIYIYICVCVCVFVCFVKYLLVIQDRLEASAGPPSGRRTALLTPLIPLYRTGLRCLV